jgi:glycosyltransferase involved in cell wall biosynthesis
MKFTLGMIAKNEERFLSLILPIIRPCFDAFVLIDSESTDRTREVAKAYGARVHIRPWTHDFSAARNSLIDQAGKEGWIFMLDGDEAMFPAHIEILKKRAEDTNFIVVPRYELLHDGRWYDPAVYPGYQGRFFRLGLRYHFRSPVHEVLWAPGHQKPLMVERLERRPGIWVDDHHMYHYGQCKPPDEIWVRHHNYGAITQGYPPLEKKPDWVHAGVVPGVPFTSPHPLSGVLRASRAGSNVRA